MKKIILLLPVLFACKIEKDPNLAELRVKSDVPAAKCASGKLSDGTYVSKCVVVRDDGKPVTFISAQGGDFPFQSWQYKSSAQLKDDAKKAEAEAAAKNQGSADSGSATPKK